MKKIQTKICPWRKVLNEILDYAPNVYDDEKRWNGARIALTDYSHPLAEKINISTDDLHDSLDFMEKMGLIEIADSTIPPLHPIELTKKGFEVAENYKKTKLSVGLNLSIIFLTAMIWLSSFFGLVNELEIVEQIMIFWGYIIAGVGFIVLVYLTVLRKLK